MIPLLVPERAGGLVERVTSVALNPFSVPVYDEINVK
ncbi:hypothetical protein SVIOM74S_09969 [Streptomyces violarus]